MKRVCVVSVDGVAAAECSFGLGSSIRESATPVPRQKPVAQVCVGGTVRIPSSDLYRFADIIDRAIILNIIEFILRDSIILVLVPLAMIGNFLLTSLHCYVASRVHIFLVFVYQILHIILEGSRQLSGTILAFEYVGPLWLHALGFNVPDLSSVDHCR